MPDDLEANVRKAADQLAKALADATELTVETRYVEIGSGGSEDLQNSSLIARTVIQLDGDHTSIIPMQRAKPVGYPSMKRCSTYISATYLLLLTTG
jgi:hypothetical protein